MERGEKVLLALWLRLCREVIRLWIISFQYSKVLLTLCKWMQTTKATICSESTKYHTWSRGHKAWGQARGHKKIRGQGQKCSKPGPRTQLQVFSKKKCLQKSFSGNLQFISVARIFVWRGPNHKSHAMTSSKICLLALNQDFAKGEGLN